MSMESKGLRMCHPSMMLHLNTKQSLYITAPLSVIPHTIFLSKTKCVYCLKYLLQAISKPLGLMQTLWSLLALPVVPLLWELSVLPNQRWVYDLGWAKHKALCLSMVSAMLRLWSSLGWDPPESWPKNLSSWTLFAKQKTEPYIQVVRSVYSIGSGKKKKKKADWP